MSEIKKFIQVGTGGFGKYWVDRVMPRLIDELRLVESAAMVDINPETFEFAMEKYHLTREKCYADPRKALAENLDRRKLHVIAGHHDHNTIIKEMPLDKQDGWMNPWLAELFVNWLNDGQTPQNCLEDNIHCAALLFAAIESAHTGKVVNVQDFLKRELNLTASEQRL